MAPEILLSTGCWAFESILMSDKGSSPSGIMEVKEEVKIQGQGRGQGHACLHDDGTVALEGSSTAVQKDVQLNEAAVSGILKYLSTKDIKWFSRVNSMWRKEARKILVKRTQVRFVGYEYDVEKKMKQYMDIMGNDCNRTVTFKWIGDNNQLEGLRAFGNKYGNQIQELSIRLQIGRSLEILGPFPHIKALTVWLDYGGQRQHQARHVPEDLVLKNLKSLTVKLTRRLTERLAASASSVTHGLLDGFARSLLTLCPSLEQLCLHDQAQKPFLMQSKNSDCELGISKEITGLRLIGVDKMFDFMKSLSLFLDLSFQLTVLEIDLFRNGNRRSMNSPWPDWLQQVLFKFAHTLQRLGLHKIKCDHSVGWTITAKSLQFPKMRNLEKLEITHYIQHQYQLGYPVVTFTFECGQVMDYMEQFPALRELSIKQIQEEGEHELLRNFDGNWRLCDMFFPTGMSPCQTLQHIDVDWRLGRLGYLGIIANAFPNPEPVLNVNGSYEEFCFMLAHSVFALQILQYANGKYHSVVVN